MKAKCARCKAMIYDFYCGESKADNSTEFVICTPCYIQERRTRRAEVKDRHQGNCGEMSGVLIWDSSDG